MLHSGDLLRRDVLPSHQQMGQRYRVKGDIAVLETVVSHKQGHNKPSGRPLGQPIPEGVAMSNPQDFRNTLGRFATGVTVVTVQHEDTTRGITVSAFMSLSLEPPLVGVCIDKRAQAYATLVNAKQYGVSILRDNQADVSTHFAGHPSLADDPFTDVHGMPLIADALAHIICDVDAQHDVGDHTFFVGRVKHLAWTEGEPLIYSQGSYRTLAPLADS